MPIVPPTMSSISRIRSTSVSLPRAGDRQPRPTMRQAAAHARPQKKVGPSASLQDGRATLNSDSGVWSLASSAFLTSSAFWRSAAAFGEAVAAAHRQRYGHGRESGRQREQHDRHDLVFLGQRRQQARVEAPKRGRDSP